MPNDAQDRAEIDALVERLVREARLPNARARDELRRELASHFEDAAEAVGARAALARFGDGSVIADGFRRAYRRGRRALYAGKIAASVLASTLVAIALQLVAHAQTAATAEGVGGVYLSAWYRPAAHVSMALVVIAVAAWELGIEPLCVRLEREPLRLLATWGVLLAAVLAAHALRAAALDPLQASMRTAATVAVWASTIAITARLDVAYLRRFGGAL